MAQKKAHEVDSFLARPSRAYPLILVYGPDKGLVHERAAIFAKNCGVDLQDPFSTIRLDATELDSDPARLGDEANTISLFGGDRLIWIRNAGMQKNLAEAIKWLVKEPPQKTFILIEAADLKKGASLRSVIEQAACAMALPCYSDDNRGIDGLIDQVLEQFKMRISLDARKWLRDSLGADRLASRGELEKLCLYAMGRDEITIEDIAASVSNVSALSQDEIIDCVITGDISTFSMNFDRQLETGAPLFLVLSAAQRQFQQLQQMRYIMDTQGKSAAAVIASSRPPIFFKRQKTVEQALIYWSSARIVRAMERLQTAVLESRQSTHLTTAIIRQNLLSLTIEANRLKK